MITSCEVHFIIQKMDNTLPGYDKSLTVDEIAQELRVPKDELLPHLDTLLNMFYINFTDMRQGKIMLTLNGKYTIVPQMQQLT